MLILSGHARTRAAERFPNVNIEEELDMDTIVQLGGQRGTSRAYLTKSEVVLIVEENTVTTVLTKNLYIGNMAARTGRLIIDSDTPIVKGFGKKKNKKDYCDDTYAAASREEKELDEKKKKEKQDKLNNRMKAIAIKDAEDDILNHRTTDSSKQARHKRLKEQGFTCKAREIYETYYRINKKYDSFC